MIQLQYLIRDNLVKILLALIAGGFGIMLVELLYSEHIDGVQMTAVYATALGLLFSIHGFFAGNRSRVYLGVMFALLSVFGLLGFFEHYGVRKTKETLALLQQASDMGAANGALLNNASGLIARVISPPLLAPLGLSGLSLFGLFTVFAGAEESDQMKRLTTE